MGVETALAIGAGSSLLGGLFQARENSKLRNQISNVSGAGNKDIMDLITNFMSQQRAGGPDPFATYLKQNPNALTPYTFDQSKAFQGYQAQDKQNLTDSLATLSAGAGSLGARFGTGFADKQAILQSRTLADTGARNAGIAQSSFYNALQAGMGAFNNQQNQGTDLLGLLLNAKNSGTQAQLQGLEFGAGLPGAGSIISGVGGGISQLGLLLPFLRGMGGGTGTGGVGGSQPSNPSSFYQPVGYTPIVR